MKFSVLLPTHNRLEFLKYAVDSVLKQNYRDCEIIISDNFSEQDIKGFVESINDERIRYFRTDRFLSVTENWNAALDKASGDYLIMLGDDDCLMKGYFNIVSKIISDFSSPELIYSNAFLYAYPGVLPNFPNGYFKTIGNAPFWDQNKPYLLKPEVRKNLLDETFNFKVMFSYNMQFATLQRDFVDRMRFQGRFFHSPYPDYYAMTLVMDQAKTVVACPYPIVTVGISPKSFGFYYFNKKESEGMGFLNNTSELIQPELDDVILPGSSMNTCWLYSLNSVRKMLSRNIYLNFARYRRLQTVEFFQSISSGENRFGKVIDFIRKLKGTEKLTNGFYLLLMLFIRLSLGIKFSTLAYKVMKRLLNSHPRFPQRKWENKYKNIFEAYEEQDPLRI